MVRLALGTCAEHRRECAKPRAVAQLPELRSPLADEAGIRQFAGEHLAAFKVPRKVLIVDEIPKGATGKLQRIGLAEKLGLA